MEKTVVPHPFYSSRRCFPIARAIHRTQSGRTGTQDVSRTILLKQDALSDPFGGFTSISPSPCGPVESPACRLSKVLRRRCDQFQGTKCHHQAQCQGKPSDKMSSKGEAHGTPPGTVTWAWQLLSKASTRGGMEETSRASCLLDWQLQGPHTNALRQGTRPGDAWEITKCRRKDLHYKQVKSTLLGRLKVSFKPH